MAVFLNGCVPMHQQFERAAALAGLQRTEILGDGFSHALYAKGDGWRSGSRPLHVYLTGDGRPYIYPRVVSADPTPRHPVVPGLLALDPAPSILLGRPCYHGYASKPPCSERLWTDERYGVKVVSSMGAALARTAPKDREIVLIGFSGGGALAVLLAQRIPNAIAVVTLAGNLDIHAWADSHDYQRLDGSLNPVGQQRPPRDLLLIHYAGARDDQVPPDLLRRAVRRIGGELTVLHDTTHLRGWHRHWPDILSELDRRLAPQNRGSEGMSVRARGDLHERSEGLAKANAK